MHHFTLRRLPSDNAIGGCRIALCPAFLRKGALELPNQPRSPRALADRHRAWDALACSLPRERVQSTHSPAVRNDSASLGNGSRAASGGKAQPTELFTTEENRATTHHSDTLCTPGAGEEA